jgi:hypothetical protein
VTGGKPIAVLLQSISDVSAINPLVAFYDIYGGKREVLFFYFVPDTTRDNSLASLMSTRTFKNRSQKDEVLLPSTEVHSSPARPFCATVKFY